MNKQTTYKGEQIRFALQRLAGAVDEGNDANALQAESDALVVGATRRQIAAVIGTHAKKLAFTEISRQEGDNGKPEIKYEVREGEFGRLLGIVYPTWSRFGGRGWTHSLTPYQSSEISRRTAARSLKIEFYRQLSAG